MYSNIFEILKQSFFVNFDIFSYKSLFLFSIVFFDENLYLNIQNLFDKKELIKNIGGYNIYKINKKLENPFFNDSNKLESHFYFRDKDYFKKIKYFISKIMNISDEIGIYPKLSWDNKIVKVIIESEKLSEQDIILANRIADIWKNLL